MQTNYELIIIFYIYWQLKTVWKQNSGSMVLTSYFYINKKDLSKKCENGIKYYLILLSHY